MGLFLKFGDVPEEILDTKRTDHGKVTNPMVIQSCNIKAVRKYLVHINGKKYGIQNFAIRNCVIDCYQAADLINFNSSSSIVKDFEISNSTIIVITKTVLVFYVMEVDKQPVMMVGQEDR